MIHLKDYQRAVYRLAANDSVENHLRLTVFQPLHLIPRQVDDQLIDEEQVRCQEKCWDNRCAPTSLQYPPSMALYSTPPCTTCVRFTGKKMKRWYSLPKHRHDFAKSDKSDIIDNTTGEYMEYAPLQSLERVALPFCLAINPRSISKLPLSSPCGDAGMPIVFVDIGCAEAVLRGSDVYAPGVITVSSHYGTNQKVLLAVQISQRKKIVEKDKDQDGDYTKVSDSSIKECKHEVQWRTALCRGQTVPKNLFMPSDCFQALTDFNVYEAKKNCLESPDVNDFHDCAVLIGGGSAQIDSRDVLKDPKRRGIAVSTEWNTWGQPSRSRLDTLLYNFCSSSGVGEMQLGEVEDFEVNSSSHSFFLQNYSSMLPPVLLLRHLSSRYWDSDSVPCLLDACAAPGGKSSLLLSLLADRSCEETSNRGEPKRDDNFRLLCCERSRSRCQHMIRLLNDHFSEEKDEESCSNNPSPKRNNWLSKVCCSLTQDVNELVKEQKEIINNDSSTKSDSLFCEFTKGNKGRIDAVLLDPPCTGMGLRPKLLPHPHTLEDIKNSANYQRKLFDSAIKLLQFNFLSTHDEPKILVYSTCTITLEENEENVLHFLRTYSGLRLARAKGEEIDLCNSAEAMHPFGTPSSLTKSKRILLEEEINAAQKSKDHLSKCRSFEEENTFPLLAIRVMPKPIKDDDSPSVNAHSLLDGVGFFVAVFELFPS